MNKILHRDEKEDKNQYVFDLIITKNDSVDIRTTGNEIILCFKKK